MICTRSIYSGHSSGSRVRSLWITKWNQGRRNLIINYLSAKSNRENGCEMSAKRDMMSIIVILEMYTRDTQSHWRPIVVRLRPRTRVQRTRSGQRALNSIQLYSYYTCIGYMYCSLAWNQYVVSTGGMILRPGP